MQLINLVSGLRESFLAGFGQLVNPSPSTSYLLGFRGQQPISLHPMKQRIQRSRTNFVSVVCKLFHHGQTKQRLLCSMNQHMDANESVEEFPLMRAR